MVAICAGTGCLRHAENVSAERIPLLRSTGGDLFRRLVLLNQAVVDGKRSPMSTRMGMLYQYGNPSNAQAHYEGTGPELLRDADDHALRRRAVHHVTLMGVGRYLREKFEVIEVIAAEPLYGELVYCCATSRGVVPELYDASVLTRL